MASFDFSHLYGFRLAVVFEELEGHSDWDTATPRPDGSVSLWRRVEAMVAGDVAEASEPPNSAALVALMQALETGALRVEADGDHTNGYEPVVVPAGLWRQRRDDRYWRFTRDRESARLDVVVWPKEHIPVYDNPRLVTPAPAPELSGGPLAVAAWVEREWAAGRAVKPDLEAVRAVCSAAVGFEVTRNMLRAANKSRRGRGRPTSSG